MLGVFIDHLFLLPTHATRNTTGPTGWAVLLEATAAGFHFSCFSLKSFFTASFKENLFRNTQETLNNPWEEQVRKFFFIGVSAGLIFNALDSINIQPNSFAERRWKQRIMMGETKAKIWWNRGQIKLHSLWFRRWWSGGRSMVPRCQFWFGSSGNPATFLVISFQEWMTIWHKIWLQFNAWIQWCLVYIRILIHMFGSFVDSQSQNNGSQMRRIMEQKPFSIVSIIGFLV